LLNKFLSFLIPPPFPPAVLSNISLLTFLHTQSCPRPSPPRTFNISQIDRPSASLAPPLPRTTSTPGPREPQPTIAYEIIKGALVRYSSASSVEQRPPPTAVLVHGILGSRRNMQSFARRLVEGFPSWQIVLVDLRCHGESTPLSPFLTSLPHGVDSAAGDVLSLLSSLKLFPEVLIGHSFGGKVVMSMAHQFGRAVKTLPKPVSVWSLDSLPGEVRSGEMGATDRPADLITTLLRTQLPIANRDALISRLEHCGFSSPVSAWAASNLTPLDSQDRSRGFVWSFDLDGIAQMYESYVTSDLWPLLARPAEGIKVSFVKAENSTFRWGGVDEEKIRALGHQVHLLRNSGHWVHTDNPDGLFDILAPSFGGHPDIHLQRSPTGSQNSEYQ
jgi:pimeloyl-ACP methyl ester carboxylesterase